MVTSLENNTQNRPAKILIISGYTPPATNGSGLMMYNLLTYFPEKSFAFLTESIDTNESLSQYRLDVPYYCYGDKLTSLNFNTKDGGILPYLRRVVKNTPVIKLFSQLLYIPYFVTKIVKLGKVAIKIEKPTQLVGYSDFGANLCATYILHKITGVPFSVYMYDAYVDNKLPFFFKQLAKILEPRLFKNAKHIFVMCDPLKQHYAKKYSRDDITVIYNSLIDMDKKVDRIEKKEKDIFTIAYVGNVYWAQLGALNNLIRALDGLSDIPVHLVLYTSHTQKHLHDLGIFESKNTHFNTCLPDEVPTVLASVDLVFIGLSFDSKYPLLINTSSPGRLCDFLRSDTPILVHAPADSFLTTYAKEKDFAFVVDNNSTENLISEIRIILRRKDLCINKTQNARNVGKLNHTAKNNSEIYFNTLTR